MIACYGYFSCMNRCGDIVAIGIGHIALTIAETNFICIGFCGVFYFEFKCSKCAGACYVTRIIPYKFAFAYITHK